MRTTILAAIAVISLAACESPITNATGPTGPELPPLGLGATAVWLEQREALVAPPPRSQDIPTSQIRAVASGEISAQQASASSTTVPERARPTTRGARAVQAFADVCVASISDLAGIESRMRAVNIRDFDEPAQVSSDDTGARLLIGGIDDGPIRVLVGLNPNGADRRALCAISTIGSNGRATAQAKADAVTAAGFGLQRIASQQRREERFRVVGAPDGTVLSIRRNALGTGATLSWR
ncbi:MAG: hypothetical protein AAF822_17945 [Pseudomonadota bacterium]